MVTLKAPYQEQPRSQAVALQVAVLALPAGEGARKTVTSIGPRKMFAPVLDEKNLALSAIMQMRVWTRLVSQCRIF